jgi:hypothetical protein
MLCYVLGAPGSGKTTLVPLLRPLLAGHAVLDWDAFIEPSGRLAGRPVRQSPRTWPGYRDLVRSVVETMLEVPVPVVLLGVCTPDELAGWPLGRWLLLDCDDAERLRRLASPAGGSDGARAVSDAAEYRQLGLPRLDSTGMTPEQAAARLAALVRAGAADASARARA